MSADGQTVFRVQAQDDEPGMLTLYRDILCVEAEEASVLEALFSAPDPRATNLQEIYEAVRSDP